MVLKSKTGGALSLSDGSGRNERKGLGKWRRKVCEKSVKEQLRGINLYFVGMMGVGKSTVGQLVAKELDYGFFDSDAVVEQAAGRSVAEIFAQEGEGAFRELESSVLSELAAYKQLVIATGGGMVLRSTNWGHMRQGLVIWLDLPVDPLYERLRQDTQRPLLQTANPKQTLTELMKQRRSRYAQADLHIITDPAASPRQTSLQVIEAIPSVLKKPEDQPHPPQE